MKDYTPYYGHKNYEQVETEVTLMFADLFGDKARKVFVTAITSEKDQLLPRLKKLGITHRSPEILMIETLNQASNLYSMAKVKMISALQYAEILKEGADGGKKTSA